MRHFERTSDGRRIFNTEFMRRAVERARSGEATVAARSRAMSVEPAPVRRWMKPSGSGSSAAVTRS